MERDNLYLHLKTGNLYEKEGDNLIIYGPYPEIADDAATKIIKQREYFQTGKKDDDFIIQKRITNQIVPLQNQLDNKMKSLYALLIKIDECDNVRYIGEETESITGVKCYNIKVNSEELFVCKDHNNYNYIKLFIKEDSSWTVIMKSKLIGVNDTIAKDYLRKIYNFLISYDNIANNTKSNKLLDKILNVKEECE